MAEFFLLQEIVRRSLAEDLIYGDRTTDALFPCAIPAMGELMAKEKLVVAGLDLCQAVFDAIAPSVQLEVFIGQGKTALPGEKIGVIRGDARALLKGERTALNFMQHLAGIATHTRRFVDLAHGVNIVDTRKTTPGLRALEKEAVLLGGGLNHRFHLGDLILIKDNHIALAGGITHAVSATRATLSHPLKIEVEVKNMQEVKEAIESGADIIMLDNMTIPEIKRAVSLIRKKNKTIPIEASGGINLTNVAEVAKCGVDMISIGSLTHSAPAVDISLEIIHDKRNIAGDAPHRPQKNRRRD
ncbi:MAG: carboxylating nicotinate-nucleotide diphosphorylase [Nitrospirota bacterium]